MCNTIHGQATHSHTQQTNTGNELHTKDEFFVRNKLYRVVCFLLQRAFFSLCLYQNVFFFDSVCAPLFVVVAGAHNAHANNFFFTSSSVVVRLLVDFLHVFLCFIYLFSIPFSLFSFSLNAEKTHTQQQLSCAACEVPKYSLCVNQI